MLAREVLQLGSSFGARPRTMSDDKALRLGETLKILKPGATGAYVGPPGRCSDSVMCAALSGSSSKESALSLWKPYLGETLRLYYHSPYLEPKVGKQSLLGAQILWSYLEPLGDVFRIVCACVLAAKPGASGKECGKTVPKHGTQGTNPCRSDLAVSLTIKSPTISVVC